MKKKIIFLILSLVLVVSLASCSLISPLIIRTSSSPYTPTSATTPTVTSRRHGISTTVTPTTSALPEGMYNIFVECNNGTKLHSVTSGDVPMPDTPKKQCAKFLYWCSDEELNHEFDFDKKIKADTTIYAKYEIDYKELTNLLSKTAIKANVQVNHTNQKSIYSTGQKSIGSGTIIKENSSYYFVLTNHHVIYPDGNADLSRSKYTIEDCYGQTYSDVTLLYRDVNYDLALLAMKKENYTKLPNIIERANDVYLNEEIIAMGEPHGQSNTITYGTILKYYNFRADPETITQSNVNFEVLSHTAHIESGSSGGALLDTNFNMVGVNFASGSDTNNVEYSYSIPLYKVKEFLASASKETQVEF